MRWNIKKRLAFIESRLFWDGKISRKDLIVFFDISTPQATKDLKLYQAKAPDNLYYDNSKKQYLATENIKPTIILQSSESYFSQLLIALLEKTKGLFTCGTMPPVYQLPNPGRKVEEQILKNVVRCIHSDRSINIKYQSMNSPDPEKRWISPHAFGFDGHRWHVRSFCYKNRQYRDFNLGRILSIYDIRDDSLDHSNDFLWHNNITFRIATHPGLTANQKKYVERDYNMINGEAEIEIKAAFHFYLKEKLKLNKGHEDSPAKEQQIVLINASEIETKIELLKNIENTRLKTTVFPE